MSLLLLFLPHNAAQGTSLSPSVLYAIDTAKPAIYAINTIKPLMTLVQEATGQWITSTITYSSATNTYNSGLYGGSEKVRPVLMTLSSIDRF